MTIVFIVMIKTSTETYIGSIEQMMKTKVIVVGAGVVGGSAALALAEQGYHVTVIDKAKEIASGASGVNGAQLSYSYTDAMASPAMLKALPRLMLGLDPAFRLTSNVDLDFMRWGIEFLQNSTSSKSDKNTVAVLELALRSCAVMNTWREKYGFDFNHRKAEKLHLYESQEALESLKSRVALKNRLGANQRIISKEELFEIEPSLQHMNANLVGAVHSPNDEVGDAAMFTQAALEKAVELGGGQILLDTKLQEFIGKGKTYNGIKTNKGEIETDYIVLCSGYQTSSIARQLRHYLPIAPMAGYTLTYPLTDYTPEISVTDTPKRMVLCRIGDCMRVAGMADIGQLTRSE